MINQDDISDEQYVEAEVVEGQPVDSRFHEGRSIKSSKKGCYIVIGCFTIFLIGLITILGGILKIIFGLISAIFR